MCTRIYTWHTLTCNSEVSLRWKTGVLETAGPSTQAKGFPRSQESAWGHARGSRDYMVEQIQQRNGVSHMVVSYKVWAGPAQTSQDDYP